MKADLIAPCGMNCALCSSYLALQNDLKKRGFGMSYCPGCRPRGKNCAFMKKNCALLGNGLVKFCFECKEFPCDRLKRLDKRYRTFYHMSMIDNLVFLKDNGMRQFLTKQRSQWRCPKCGKTICCHNGVCYNCEVEKLKVKKPRYRWE
jgi:hypothetical protein